MVTGDRLVFAFENPEQPIQMRDGEHFVNVRIDVGQAKFSAGLHQPLVRQNELAQHQRGQLPHAQEAEDDPRAGDFGQRDESPAEGLDLGFLEDRVGPYARQLHAATVEDLDDFLLVRHPRRPSSPISFMLETRYRPVKVLPRKYVSLRSNGTTTPARPEKLGRHGRSRPGLVRIGNAPLPVQTAGPAASAARFTPGEYPPQPPRRQRREAHHDHPNHDRFERTHAYLIPPHPAREPT